MTAAPLIVVLDPLDEAATTRHALDAHAPERGAITVHPTPGQRTRAALCHDILAALGIDPVSQSELKLRQKSVARAAVLTHLPARGVRQVAVLRTHLFTAEQWRVLLDVREHAGAAVIALYHAPRVTGHAAWMLERTRHVLAASLHEADLPLQRFLAAALPATPPAGEIAAPDAALPPVPASGVQHFRADAARTLPPDQFALLDAQYRLGAHSACGWITGHAHDTRGPGWVPPAPSADEGGEALAVFLADLVADAGCPRASIARIRGAQAGFLLHGKMLRCEEPLADAAGPGLSTAPLDAQRCDLLRARLAHPVHAAALAAVLITGSDPRWLRRLRVADLTGDASGFHLPHPRLGREWYPVPLSARAIFQAARAFVLYRCADPHQSLLTIGIGREGALVHACAQRCGLSLPPLHGPHPAGSWHHRAELLPADPLPERDGQDDLLFALGLPTRDAPPGTSTPHPPRDPYAVPWRRHVQAQQQREQEDLAAGALRQAREPYLRPMFRPLP